MPSTSVCVDAVRMVNAFAVCSAVVAVEREFVLADELPLGEGAAIHAFNDAVHWGLPLDPTSVDADDKSDPLDELTKVGSTELCPCARRPTA